MPDVRSHAAEMMVLDRLEKSQGDPENEDFGRLKDICAKLLAAGEGCFERELLQDVGLLQDLMLMEQDKIKEALSKVRARSAEGCAIPRAIMYLAPGQAIKTFRGRHKGNPQGMDFWGVEGYLERIFENPSLV